MTDRFEVEHVVIGNGLIGSAAGRHLAAFGSSVAIVGPGEPASPETHDGVFSSHYDQGRLCTYASRDPIWGPIGACAIAGFPALEEASGISFHRGVGWVRAVRLTAEQRAATDRWYAQLERTTGVAATRYGPDDRSRAECHPMLVFPEGLDLLVEPGPAGYLNPRQMLEAQNTVATANGARVVPERVVSVQTDDGGVTVRTESGLVVTAGRALVACGAFTNFGGLLPEPLPFRLKTETTIWATVTAETAAALDGMPGVGYDIDDPELDDVYLAPPIRYPDGTYRIKMGCNTAGEQWPETLIEVQEWFRSGSSDDDRPGMERALRSILPTVDLLDVTAHRCIVAYTPSGYPTIDAAPGDRTGRLFVAAGGNGTGAQGSDTLGLLAAGLLFDGRWLDEIPREPFRAASGWDDRRAAGRTDRSAADGARYSKAQARAANR
ncbi:MAG: FAD-binding oxidoreductase [Actinomycetota bacterium]